MQVLLVGAGATVAEAATTRPRRALQPPLDSTFFDLVGTGEYSGSDALSEYLSLAYGIDIFDGRSSMEEVFNIVYADAQSASATEAAIEAYWSLLSLYREVIRRTTNPLTGRGRSGSGAVLRAICRFYGPYDFGVVTFNQDLLIEKAVDEACRTTAYREIPWIPQRAYGVRFVNVGPMMKRSHPFHENDTADGGTIPVLKLHGSLNWVYRVRSDVDPRNALRSPARELECIYDRQIRTGVTVRNRSRNRRHTFRMQPLVVPPVFEKSPQIRSALAPVWRCARRLLEEAKTLVVFGYSFPAADVLARNLLRRAFHSNEELTSIHVIDCNPNVVSVVARLAPGRSVSYHPDASSFARFLER